MHKSLQLCPTFCDPMDCSPPGSSVHGDSPGKNTGVGCHALLQGSSQSRDRIHISYVSCLGRWFFTTRGTWETPTLAQIPSFLIHIIVPTPTLLPGLSPSHHSLKFKWVWSFQEINLGKSFHWLLPKYPSTASKFLFYLKQAYFTTFLSGQAFSPFQKFFILLSWCLSWMCHDGYRLLCLCLCHSLCASNALCISSFSWLATTHKCGWVLNLLFSFPLTSFPRPRFKLCAPILCSQSTWTSPIIMSGYCFFIACLFVCFHTLKNVQSVSTYLTIPSPWFCMILDQLGSIKLTKQSINWINEWMNGRMDGWMDG